MSTIKVNNIVPPNVGEGVSIDGLQMPTAGALSNRNLIINGDMVHDQRSNGSVFATTGATYGTCDRWSFQYSNASKYTGQQVSDGPVGFKKSLKANVASAFTVSSTSYFLVEQAIEGYNFSSLCFGTADAKPVSISFWVKASVTGTYSLALRNSDNTRSIVQEYTINTANTWEYKTITTPGDTTGTYNTTNGVGIRLVFGLGIGSSFEATAGTWVAGNKFTTSSSVRLIETQDATWQVTGVQLEVGSKATPFEYESYSQTLAKCQRYYYRTTASSNDSTVAVGFNQNGSATRAVAFFPVTMRAAPTALEQSGTASDVSIYHGTSLTVCTSVPSFNSATQHCAEFQAISSGLTTGQGCTISLETTGYLAWSAEL